MFAGKFFFHDVVKDMSGHIPVKIIVIKNNYLGMVREFQHYAYKDNYSVVDIKDGKETAGSSVSPTARLSMLKHLLENRPETLQSTPDLFSTNTEYIFFI